MTTTRRMALVAAAVIGLGTLLFTSAPAGAAGELDHAVEECIHELEEANSIDVECQEAPSPILPETNEIIWGAFGFLVVFGFLFWKGYPAIKKAMNDRTEKIRGDIEGAEASKAEADKVLAQYHAQLADARNESARILEEARQDADAVRQERIAAIDGEIAEMRQRAATEIEASKAQALADLRGEITALALGAAERVVERNLDDATNRALIDSYIESVGASS
ncbi:F0F1 ATP synthase subunit B [Iamia sp. SCSIO 61187]|uniref:F0F1 ATP synthase subunit B n=1 Tax=Iamia sp. SCSIO 61187 TaxID=2722752 RepID=UPI001C629A53|nr:F0F1 ATP synthase subunit B [Iamia sp. SCSIO 61187]QYG94595.1 F0F1 ATP synthase subunit B [Iamia sp. SCSIO 61187]